MNSEKAPDAVPFLLSGACNRSGELRIDAGQLQPGFPGLYPLIQAVIWQ